MTILVVSLQRPFAGPSRSRRRSYFIPAPVSVSTTSLISPRSVLATPAGVRAAIRSAFRLSPISSKPSSANAAARPNPHRRPLLAAVLRVRSSEAFGRRPLYRVHCSRPAGIRNYSRERTSPESMPMQTPRRASQRSFPLTLTHSMTSAASAIKGVGVAVAVPAAPPRRAEQWALPVAEAAWELVAVAGVGVGCRN
jgi:hypothetical protein